MFAGSIFRRHVLARVLVFLALGVLMSGLASCTTAPHSTPAQSTALSGGRVSRCLSVSNTATQVGHSTARFAGYIVNNCTQGILSGSLAVQVSEVCPLGKKDVPLFYSPIGPLAAGASLPWQDAPTGVCETCSDQGVLLEVSGFTLRVLVQVFAATLADGSRASSLSTEAMIALPNDDAGVGGPCNPS